MKFSTLLQYVTPHRWTLLIIVLLLLLQSSFALAGPWLAGQLTGLVIGEPGILFQSAGLVFIVWLGAMALKSILSFFSSYLVGSTGEQMAANLRSRIYQHMQVLPLNHFQQRSPGESLSLLSNDAEEISNFVTRTLVQLLPLCVTFLGALLIMVWLDYLITLLAVTLLPFYYLAIKLMGRKIRPIAAARMTSWSDLFSLVQENLGLLPTIKAFVREPIETNRFNQRNDHLFEISRRQVLLQSTLPPTVSFLASLGLVALLWLGFRHVESGQLEPSELVSLLLYAVMMTAILSGLANVYGSVMHTRGASDRLLKFFAVSPEPVSERLPSLCCIGGAIEFQNVGFSYPERNVVFQNFNLKIPADQTIAFTGPNGTGKSTLAHLLLRFMDPQSGKIVIDGTNIAEVNLRSVRNQIGLVAQNTLLLNGSVAENIAYGNPRAKLEDIKKAAIAARANEFVDALPQQYDTIIGDQGVKLSGGQRQRLSLARTLLKNPKILILDEATAMFDPEGETGFIEECRDLLRGKTVIMITHRPASLLLADRVLRLEPDKSGIARIVKAH